MGQNPKKTTKKTGLSCWKSVTAENIPHSKQLFDIHLLKEKTKDNPVVVGLNSG